MLTRSPAAGAAAARCTRIIGVLGVLALAVGLQGCSVMKIAYNQGPELAYWHLDGHFDFTDAQTLQVKTELARLQVEPCGLAWAVWDRDQCVRRTQRNVSQR